MLINVDSIKINLEIFREAESLKKSLFLLHGFTGSLEDWRNLSLQFDESYNIYAMDLIGHGKSDVPADITFYSAESQVNQLKNVIDKFKSDKNILLGYSMGGRLALSFAANNPGLLNGLILESASEGINKIQEREKRKTDDDKLAELVLKNPVEEFMTKWMDQELFGTLRRFSNAKIGELKKQKCKTSRTGLANSLRGFSTGVMPYLGNQLKAINFPVLLLSGQLDSKFTKINSHLQNHFPKAKHSVIKNAGHNTHLEEPKTFLQTVNKFLGRF